MAAPFIVTALDATHGWDPLNDGPVVELNNQLAQASAVTEITRENLAALESRFQVSLTRDYSARLEEFYTDFIEACIDDKQFTPDEVSAIWHLKALFEISDTQHTELYRDVATRVYVRSVEDVLADFTVTEEEKRFLAQLGEYLDLPEDLRLLALDSRTQLVLRDAFDLVTGDGVLDDNELAQLRLLQKQLGRSFVMSDDDRATFQRARLVWTIKHAPKLEPLESVALKLAEGEVCYVHRPASFIELPRATCPLLNGKERRSKLTSGAYWHTEIGDVAGPQHVRDAGEVFLTNRHLWLDGRKENSKLGLHQIEDFDACPAWLDIRCERGKMLRLTVTKHADVFAHYLARVLRDL